MRESLLREWRRGENFEKKSRRKKNSKTTFLSSFPFSSSSLLSSQFSNTMAAEAAVKEKKRKRSSSSKDKGDKDKGKERERDKASVFTRSRRRRRNSHADLFRDIASRSLSAASPSPPTPLLAMYAYKIVLSNHTKPTKKTNNSQLSRSGPDRPFPPAAADAALCRRSPSPPPCQQGCCRRRSGRSLLLLRGGRAPQASGSAPRPGPTGAGSRGEVQQVEGEAGKDPAGRRRRRVVGRPFGGAQGSSCCSCCCCCCCCCACCCCPRLSAAASTAAAAAAEETDRDPDGTLSENLRHRPYLLEQAPSRKGNGARLRREGAGCFGSRGSRGLCGR